MKNWILPTRKQWRSWSLPSKLTLIGAYVGLIGLALTIYSFYHNENKGSHQSRAIIQSVDSFSDDLEKIKTLLPRNTYLSKCIMLSLNDKYEEILGDCILEIEQTSNDPQKIFDKNISNMSLLIDGKDLQKLLKNYEEISHLIYEMQNNQYTYEILKINKCPERYTFAPSSEIKDRLAVIVEDFPGCVLFVEAHKDFKERMTKNEDYISPLHSGTVKREKIHYLAYPGNDILIADYFYNTNNSMYKGLINNFSILKRELINLVNKYG